MIIQPSDKKRPTGKALPRSSRVTKSGKGGRETGDGSGSESQS